MRATEKGFFQAAAATIATKSLSATITTKKK
jgi:hypothetical protein